MVHARLTHPIRGTLPFRQGQQDDWEREAKVDVTSEIGVDRPSIVNTVGREGTRTISGTVSGLRRKRDTSATDAVQALSNYVTKLEAHVDEFQGDQTTENPGYTFEGDRLEASKNAVLESIEWSLSPGRIYEVDYKAKVRVGKGTFEARDIDREFPSVKGLWDEYLRVDGNKLLGMREYQLSKSLGLETSAVFDRDSAEQNDIMVEDGEQRRIVFEGEHYGTLFERRQADATLDNLHASKNAVEVRTKFPGYDLEMFVTGYKSTLEEGSGGHSHRYRIELVEGERA